MTVMPKEAKLTKELKSKIYGWIQKNYPDGIELYADYRDYLYPDGVQDILDEEYSRDAFYERVDRIWEEYGDETLLCEFRHMVKDLGIFCEWGDDLCDELWCFFSEYCYCCVPSQQYEAQFYNCDILLDTGNWNYDCTCEAVNAAGHIPDESSLLWLARTQGFTKEQLELALTTDRDCGTFLNSVRQEVQECTSDMNVLAFFKKFTLGELLDMAETKKPLKISKNIRCGLFDPFNGCGSILDIKLETDIEIPFELIGEILIDKAHRGYNGRYCGVDHVYGMCDGFWKE